MNYQPMYINGKWVSTGSRYEVKNRYTGETLAMVCRASAVEVDEAVKSADRAFKESSLSPMQRFTILMKASELILAKQESISLTITREVGKPLKEAALEVARAANTFSIAAEEAKRISGEVVPLSSPGTENKIAYTIRVPLGVVCAITPFNFPLNLAAHKVAPAIAAGNTVVLKPASATPLSSMALCGILEEAGLPPGHLNVITGSGNEVGEMLLDDRRIACYTFTGSPSVGMRIRDRAGLRKCTLEMGSNSANIVHSDADLDKAAAACARTAFANAGQVCISVQRILVQKKVLGVFTRKLVALTEKLVVGDPMDPKTDIGPMISEKEARRAEKWIEEADAGGAAVLTGGRRDGCFLYPTIITDAKPDMKVVCDEIFAPVVTVIPYDTFEEAIEMVNDSRYGLQAGVFTGSLSLAMLAARKLEVGGVIINDTCAYRTDEMPYGGIKESGLGREGPRYVIEELTEPRLVVVNL